MSQYSLKNISLYYKLVSLWIIVEAFLGGVIHAFNLPISGLFVASGAVGCLCLLAYYCNNNKTILQATILVAVCKATLSPQSPPTAYIAVFFQGLLAQILFKNITHFKLKCVVLTVFALVESAFQKILVLMLLYGNSFFDALNKFITKLTHSNNYHNYSLFIALIYLLIHLFAALFIGYRIGNLPKQIALWQSKYFLMPTIEVDDKIDLATKNGKDKKIKPIVLALISLLVVLVINFYDKSILQHIAIKIIVRVVVLICAWLIVLEPISKFLLNKWLAKTKSKYALEVAIALQSLPTILQLIKQCWYQANNQQLENKLGYFIKLVLSEVLR